MWRCDSHRSHSRSFSHLDTGGFGIICGTCMYLSIFKLFIILQQTHYKTTPLPTGCVLVTSALTLSAQCNNAVKVTHLFKEDFSKLRYF